MAIKRKPLAEATTFAYCGYLIRYLSMQDQWTISKGEHHISYAPTRDAAMCVVEELHQ